MQKQYTVSADSVLVFRVLLSGIFIIAGSSHIFTPEKSTVRIEKSTLQPLLQNLGDAHTLGIISGTVLLSAGLLLMSGFYTRWAATSLLLVLIPITVTVQTDGGLMHGPLWKNIALAGALLFFVMNPLTPKTTTASAI